MNITLSWDLFIMVFFAVIIAYSFIIGKNQTLQVIIATYIAILTADAIGNLLHQYLLKPGPLLQALNLGNVGKALIFLKVAIFIIAIVVIAVKGGFSVDVADEPSSVVRLVMTFIFGFLNAGLIVSTVLVYISGISFVTGTATVGNGVIDLYSKSELVRLMINNYNFWFSVPAIAFVISSLVSVSQRE